MKFYLAIILCVFSNVVFSQSVSTSTINMGGKSAVIKNFQFDWNIGEGASISTFLGAKDLMISTGVLQPAYKEKFISNNLGPQWTKDEINMFPIPAKDFVSVNFKIEAVGNILLEFSDQFGKKIETRMVNYSKNEISEKFDLNGLSPGFYYINVIMTAAYGNSVLRTGSFKIVKL